MPTLEQIIFQLMRLAPRREPKQKWKQRGLLRGQPWWNPDHTQAILKNQKAREQVKKHGVGRPPKVTLERAKKARLKKE